MSYFVVWCTAQEHNYKADIIHKLNAYEELIYYSSGSLTMTRYMYMLTI